MPVCVRAPLLLLVLLGAMLPTGCGRGGGENGGAAGQQQPAAGSLPAVTESLADIRGQMAPLVLVENDRHIISSPEEFEKWRLKALIKLDEIRRREGVAGFKQEPVEKTKSQHGIVDAESHKIAWRALTCWNPACLGQGKGGGPLVFAKQWEHASIGPDGNLKWKTLSDEEVPSPASCPSCGRLEFVRPYDEPDVEIRRQKLAEELSESRRIRAEAEAAGQLVPAGVRTPSEIMREMTLLPKLFVLPENG